MGKGYVLSLKRGRQKSNKSGCEAPSTPWYPRSRPKIQLPEGIRTVRIKLIPKEQPFFELFEAQANKVREGSEELLDLLKNYTDIDSRVERIFGIEHEGDEITHELMRRLNTTFITPFDREDIHQLATSLDDVLDHIEAAAEALMLHKLDSPHPEILRLAETLADAANRTAAAMPSLRAMKGFQEYFVEINRLENEADRRYRRTIADLFSGRFEALEVLKNKDVIQEIEAAMDRLEDVANTIEGIVLKHA
jgi:predicted phosphate transport protein (TIGR00153 family)